MDLIFFDLDGTLLNKASELTPFTRETLLLLSEKNIAHTVATGRTMLSAKRVLKDYAFSLPHIFSNGVAIWHPGDNALELDNLLEQSEVNVIIEQALNKGLAPFVNTIASQGAQHQHIIFHAPTHHAIEKDLINNHFAHSEVMLKPLSAMDSTYPVTNISMIGANQTVKKIYDFVENTEGLIAYSGPAVEGEQYSWIDIHHKLANKGSAVQLLKAKLGANNIICFGDSYNDLSMFEFADEAYAPDNAKDKIKQVANEVIGHHHDDGVARFLRERFSL